MSMRNVSMCVVASAILAMGGGYLFTAVGCGEDKPRPAPVAPVVAAPEPAKVVVEAAVAPKVEENVPVTPVNLQDGASIKGNVKIKGDLPKRRKVKMDADPKCAAMHEEAPLDDSVVADAEGNVQYAFVYVKKGLEGKKFEVPKTPSVIDQKGCRYEPHVLGVMVGQDLLIRNSDDLLHNIHALPFANKEFNFGQPQKGMEEKRQFNTVEVMVKFKCDVHPWMGAWLGVLDHPFHATTDAKGNFEIKGLPGGAYTVEAWQEKYKSVTKEITVKEKEAAAASFEFTDKKE